MSNNARDNIPSQNEEQGAEEGSDPTQALVPVDEREIDFYGDALHAALVRASGQEQIYVPLRPICDYLGLDWSAQLQRMKRTPTLQRGRRVVKITTRRQGGDQVQDMVCLRVDLIAGWLFGVTVGKVKPELQEKVERYQDECYAILARVFQADTLTTTRAGQTTDAITALEQIRTTALAVAQMAEQQIELERKQAATDQRLDRAAAVVGDIQKRLAVVEKRTAPQQVITDEEAEEVASAVKALAEYLTSKNPAEKWYQSIYNALYKQFGVTSYKRIRKGQLEQVMAFLEDWRSAAETEQTKTE